MQILLPYRTSPVSVIMRGLMSMNMGSGAVLPGTNSLLHHWASVWLHSFHNPFCPSAKGNNHWTLSRGFSRGLARKRRKIHKDGNSNTIITVVGGDERGLHPRQNANVPETCAPSHPLARSLPHHNAPHWSLVQARLGCRLWGSSAQPGPTPVSLGNSSLPRLGFPSGFTLPQCRQSHVL